MDVMMEVKRPNSGNLKCRLQRSSLYCQQSVRGTHRDWLLRPETVWGWWRFGFVTRWS